ncbi:MAG: hypothetical protein CL477_16280 [Acidobacteria bacterium]|nr:hypothetical protein [Acidobacteriota bacterium]
MTPIAFLSRLRCRTVRSWVSVAHDGELSLERQVAMDAHLARCARCRRIRDELALLRIALIQGATEHRAEDEAFARLAPEVLARTTLEQDASLGRRVRELVEEGHRLWFIGGALAATMTVAVLVATVLSLATPVHPRSLARVLRTSSRLGTNANPISLAKGVTWAGPAEGSFAYAAQLLPRVLADTRAAAMLMQPLPPLLLENLALTAVVTREGELASVEVLRESAPDADLARAVSRLASGVRFVPARAAGAPVAVSVIWLIERMTVRAES